MEPCGYHTVSAKDKGQSQSQSDDPRTRPARPSYCEHYELDQTKTFESCWKTHKDKSMREIQIESLEWTITKEKQKPKDYSDREIQNLNEVLEKLKKSNEVFPPRFPFVR